MNKKKKKNTFFLPFSGHPLRNRWQSTGMAGCSASRGVFVLKLGNCSRSPKQASDKEGALPSPNTCVVSSHFSPFSLVISKRINFGGRPGRRPGPNRLLPRPLPLPLVLGTKDWVINSHGYTVLTNKYFPLWS